MVVSRAYLWSINRNYYSSINTFNEIGMDAFMPDPAAKPGLQPVATPAKAPTPGVDVAPTAGPTKLRKRHGILALSFVLAVLLPAALTAAYLWVRAADQYASTVGFSVRHEESASALDILGGNLAGLSGSSSTDTDILYEFIQSQKLVADMDAALDLKALWSKPENDWFFAFEPSGSIEDLIAYWDRMVKIYYDRTAGLIEVRVLAFSAEDATRIATTLFNESSEMINDLSAIAREDAIRYSREELDEAKVRLTSARAAVLAFRNQHQLVDPSIEVESQSQLIGSLQAQLANTLIQLDLLREGVGENDPRLEKGLRRVKVIEDRIAAERHKLGVGSDGTVSQVFADLIGEYERLVVEREFAEKTYISALATYDASLAEARRKSRYLAAYMRPTEAETSRFPERGLLLGLISLFLFLIWSIAALVGYSLKDRR